jgi:hypothetical protein
MTEKQTKRTKFLLNGVPGKNFMNQKRNWSKRGRSKVAGVSIPVRFDSARAFDIKIKRPAANGLLDLDPPHVPGIFDLRARVNGIETLMPLAFFKRVHAAASGALSHHHTILHERRLEAVLRATRKKR